MDGLDESACVRASGYLELGMPEDALAELERAGAESSLALRLRVDALLLMERWAEAAVICLPMLQREPDLPGWWIQAAFALRRARSLADAENILRAGHQRHPDDWLISYNLACYACVQGHHRDACRLLERALHFGGAQVLRMAAADPDLADIRHWLAERSAEVG